MINKRDVLATLEDVDTRDVSNTTVGGVNLLDYIDAKIAEAIAGSKDDDNQWESFSMSGLLAGTLTFVLTDGVYVTNSIWSFSARDGGGWTLSGYAMGLYTTDDVEYPYQGTTWYESTSINSSVVITKIS